MTRRTEDDGNDYVEDSRAGYDVYVHVEHEGGDDGQAPEVHVHVHGPEGHGHGYDPRHLEDPRGRAGNGCLAVMWGFLFGWWIGGDDI